MDTIASRIRFAREQAGLSQGQVARMLGKHRPTISEIEAGRRRVTAEELVEFSRIYEVQTNWILSGDDASTTSSEDVLLAARELARLKPKELEGVLRFLKTRTRKN